MGGTKTLIQGAGVALAIVLVVLVSRFVARTSSVVHGAVIAASSSAAREFPLADVEVAVSGGPETGVARSDASGFFSVPIPLRQLMRVRAPLSLVFRHPGYQTLELHNVPLGKLCIARLTPLVPQPPLRPPVSIGHVVAQYSTSTTSMINVGSAVKTFDVVNSGNVPCENRHICSPDGRWAASTATVTLDAGEGNEFRNARASCIAGPCPFTRIQSTDFNAASQKLRVTALDWSDTATFLVEAEVYRPIVTDVMRNSYPVIFGAGMSFTLPAAAEGVCLQAEIDKNMIVFPLGPLLLLDWADCNVLTNRDQTRVYRCQLKPGYQFAQPRQK